MLLCLVYFAGGYGAAAKAAKYGKDFIVLCIMEEDLMSYFHGSFIYLLNSSC